VIVSGHSHIPKIETIGGVLYLNPGSAGPRFKLPITLRPSKSRRTACDRIFMILSRLPEAMVIVEVRLRP
jgi:hypothetical protein